MQAWHGQKAQFQCQGFPQTQRRVESGKNLQMPLQLGEQIQTGENSSAEVLLFGGIALLTAGSVLILRTKVRRFLCAYFWAKLDLKWPLLSVRLRNLHFTKNDGSLLDIPKEMISVPRILAHLFLGSKTREKHLDGISASLIQLQRPT